MAELYTYAVARIRALEVSLFTASTIEQLLACKTEEQAIQLLVEKGWGDADTPANADAILTREEEKIWETMKDLGIEMSVFDVLTYPNLFHNLKAAIKEVCTKEEHPDAFYTDCAINREEMVRIVREKDYARLPEHMQHAAQDAYESLLHSNDGQKCDVIIDKATLDAIYAAGKEAKDAIIQDYAKETVAVADIKVAVRCQKTGKSLEFMKQALAECEGIDVNRLAQAALTGMDSLLEYLTSIGYGDGAEALAESPSAFERWCDNRMIETIRPQKYNAFTIGPLVAYVIARENEIKTVRIILSGKANEFPEDSIRERVREMYV